MAQTAWVTIKEESRELMAIWPDIIRDSAEMIKTVNVPDVDIAAKWMEKVSHY